MRDPARVQSTIECLDQALKGQPLEAVLTAWGRANRYAGSKDRAAIRDYAYQAWRCRRSAAWLGGAGDTATGRALMLGLLRQAGQDPAAYFTGERHAPAPLTEAERRESPPMPEAVALDLPDWQLPLWQAQAGPSWRGQAQHLRQRAPVHLRVNTQLTNRETAMQALREDGIECTTVSGVETALEIREGAKRLATSTAHRDGWVELQDAASQALALAIPLTNNAKVLDFCAGGGGKSLALAARAERPTLTAHDANPARMSDIPNRANRAKTRIERCTASALAGRRFDVVLCDSPCSGSGSWRRDPDGKWALTPEKLNQLTDLQRQILQDASCFVGRGGILAHATCSIFAEENADIVNRFLTTNTQFEEVEAKKWPVEEPSDGFGLILLRRKN